MHIHIYTHKQNHNSPTKIKHIGLTQRTKETKNYIQQLRTKLTKAKIGNQTKMRYQLVNKVMKTKLTHMLRGNKEKKKEQIYKVKWRQMKKTYTLKINCKGKRTVGKANKGIYV